MSKHLTKPAITSASLAALLSAHSAEALIITNSDLSAPGFTAGISNSESWNIDGANLSEVSFWGYITGTTSSYYGGFYSTNVRNGFGFLLNGSNSVLNLPLSQTIDGADSFHSGSYLPLMRTYQIAWADGFTDQTDGYIGFRFTPDTTTLYGWARVQFNEAQMEFSVLEWAYDDSGNSIQVGQTSVPEPAETAVGLGALALGAAGLRRWRKNRKAA